MWIIYPVYGPFCQGNVNFYTQIRQKSLYKEFCIYLCFVFYSINIKKLKIWLSRKIVK